MVDELNRNSFNNGSSTKDPFASVTDVKSLIPLLKKRLPSSRYVYNIVHQSILGIENGAQFYTLETDGIKCEEKWIVVTMHREDLDKNIAISTSGNCKVTPGAKTAFSTAKFIDWKKEFLILSPHIEITRMVSEIILEKGVPTILSPCHLYYLPEGDNPKSDPRSKISPPPGVEVKSFNKEDGVSFFLSTWKYALAGTDKYIERMLAQLPSAGCFVNGEPVCGILNHGYGLMGMLFTKKEHRGKGLARISMLSLIDKTEKDGFLPCSCLLISNTPSKAFHEKLGMVVGSSLDFFGINMSH